MKDRAIVHNEVLLYFFLGQVTIRFLFCLFWIWVIAKKQIQLAIELTKFLWLPINTYYYQIVLFFFFSPDCFEVCYQLTSPLALKRQLFSFCLKLPPLLPFLTIFTWLEGPSLIMFWPLCSDHWLCFDSWFCFDYYKFLW